ncbi:MAG: hypothetical protein RMI04_02005 [Thermofilaceae archaeon]|nr:hypothetical protein [Thermofilaceae archaeon]
MEQDVDKLRKRRRELVERLSVLESRIGEVRSQRDLLNKQLKELGEKIKALRAQKEALEKELESSKKVDYSEEIVKLNNDKVKLMNEAEALRRQIKLLLEKIDRHNLPQDKEELRNRMKVYAQVEAELKRIDSRIKELMDKHLSEKRSLELKKVNLTQLREELVALVRKRNAIKKKVDELHVLYVNMSKEASELRDELERVNVLIKAAEIAGRLKKTAGRE